MNNYYDTFTGKFAGYNNYVSYKERVTPFFYTVQEVEAWEKENNIDSDYIHPVANWQESKAIAADGQRTNLFTEETDISTLPLFAKSTQAAYVQVFAPKPQARQISMFAMEF